MPAILNYTDERTEYSNLA